MEQLAAYKAEAVPAPLRRSVQLAWQDRWWAMLDVAVQNAIAASLLAAQGHKLILDMGADGSPPVDLLLDGQRWALDGAALGFD